MAAGRVLHTLVLPWHLSLDRARHRVDECAPSHHHWLLSAASADNWIVHQLIYPDMVRLRLHDLERREPIARGGMRAMAKVHLQVIMRHSGQTQAWKVDTDMTIAYLIKAIALEEEIEERDVLVMRGTHIPGAEECIIAYMPAVHVYLIPSMSGEEGMTHDCMRAGVLWQWAKKAGLPSPKGPPRIICPMGQKQEVLHCHLRPAHSLDQMYVVHVSWESSVADVLKNLEAITTYPATSMLVVKEGVILSTREHAAMCNPVSYLLVGDKLDSADVCAEHAIDWEEMWSVTNTEDTTPRGGANARTTQQPRSVILLWAEDKIKREIPGLNILTIRMLLKAEQRTVSAILHSRSIAQTKEILIAAYRRAGLSFDQAPPPTESHGDLGEMTRALMGQATICSQIANQLAAMPTNQDFLRLLEAVNRQKEVQNALLAQNGMIMEALQTLHGQLGGQGGTHEEHESGGENEAMMGTPIHIQDSPPRLTEAQRAATSPGATTVYQGDLDDDRRMSEVEEPHMEVDAHDTPDTHAVPKSPEVKMGPAKAPFRSGK